MALFEPIDAEKEAASYLQWDDAELGKFTKYVGLTLDRIRNDSEGLHRVAVASCAMMIIGQCVESGAGSLTLKLDGYMHRGLPEGDWVLTVERRSRQSR